MTSTNAGTGTYVWDVAVSRILDAWCAERRAGEAHSRSLDVRTMAEIAAAVMRAGRTWQTGQTIDADVDTVWLAPELKATRTDDPAWWRINAEILESHLLAHVGPVTEHQRELVGTPHTTRQIGVTARVPAGEYVIPADVMREVRSALTAAVITLEYLTERRGATITVDMAARCAANARACDRAWEALKNTVNE